MGLWMETAVRRSNRIPRRIPTESHEYFFSRIESDFERAKYEYEKSEEMEEVRMGRYRKQAFVVRKISISSPGDIYGMVLIYFTPASPLPLLSLITNTLRLFNDIIQRVV